MTSHQTGLPRRWLPLLCVLCAYGLLVVVGILVFFSPSPSLLKQGGLAVVIAWGICCISGGVLGLTGLLTKKVFIRLLGAQLSATASLIWAASLVLQATTQTSAITAASMAGVMTLLFAQRWVDAYRDSRR